MQNRNGMTILEVLFAIMITVIGLLGAIAVFPVASEAARKGRLNDQLAVSAETVAHVFDTQGMRRPTKWIAYVDQSSTNQPALAYRGDALPSSFPASIWKTAYCLDPRFTAQNVAAHGSNEQNWTYFPAYPKAFPASPRMQRITLAALGSGLPAMTQFQADKVFSIEDFLTYERPKDNSLDARQIYSGTMNNPGKREDDGKLSWMATLTPKIDRNNADASGNGIPTDNYVLSIVVFDKRSPSLVTRDFITAPPTPVGGKWSDNEWTISIAGPDFYGQGFGGGEVRLNSDFEEKLDVHTGSWLMLAGMQPNQRDNMGNFLPPYPAPVFKWYRVSDCGDVDTATVSGVTRFVRNVTLIGPDWDFLDMNNDGIWDDAEVTVMPNVATVWERTVRLETDGNDF